MPGFKKSRIFFRPLELSDANHISKWLAESLGQSPGWARQLRQLLQDEWQRTEKLSRQMGWMAMAGNEPLFFLEIAAEDEVFLTAPRGVLDNRPTALAAWRRAVVHLRGLGTLQGIRITLDQTRDLECECLLQLGFKEMPPPLTPNGSNPRRTFLLAW